MNLTQAIALANALTNESEAEQDGMIFHVVESDNDPEQWAVTGGYDDDDEEEPLTIRIWVSPTLSFAV